MAKSGDADTINNGPAPQREKDVADPAGNARRKSEDPSPDDRERGETSGRDLADAIDLDSTRQRAG